MTEKLQDIEHGKVYQRTSPNDTSNPKSASNKKAHFLLPILENSKAVRIQILSQ